MLLVHKYNKEALRELNRTSSEKYKTKGSFSIKEDVGVCFFDNRVLIYFVEDPSNQTETRIYCNDYQGELEKYLDVSTVISWVPKLPCIPPETTYKINRYTGAILD